MSEFMQVSEVAKTRDPQAIAIAIARWYRDFGPALRLVAKRCLRSLHLEMELDPDDVLNSAFLTLCRRPNSLYDIEPGKVYTYLKQMVKHHAIGLYRRRMARKRGHGNQRQSIDLDRVCGHNTDIVDEAILREEMQLAREKLGSLDQKICNCRADGLEWSKIGQLTGTSASAARKRYERALRRIALDSQD